MSETQLPWTYREVSDLQRRYRNQPQYRNLTLPQFADTLNKQTGTTLFSAGLDDNWLRQASTGLDRIIESTGIPEHTGRAFQQVGAQFGMGKLGYELGKGFPRSVVDFLPMIALGPVGGAPALGGLLASATLGGARTYADTGSPAAGMISGATLAAAPGFGHKVGTALATKFGKSLLEKQILGTAGGFGGMMGAFEVGGQAQSVAMGQGMYYPFTKEHTFETAMSVLPFMLVDAPIKSVVSRLLKKNTTSQATRAEELDAALSSVPTETTPQPPVPAEISQGLRINELLMERQKLKKNRKLFTPEQYDQEASKIDSELTALGRSADVLKFREASAKKAAPSTPPPTKSVGVNNSHERSFRPGTFGRRMGSYGRMQGKLEDLPKGTKVVLDQNGVGVQGVIRRDKQGTVVVTSDGRVLEAEEVVRDFGVMVEEESKAAKNRVEKVEKVAPTKPEEVRQQVPQDVEAKRQATEDVEETVKVTQKRAEQRMEELVVAEEKADTVPAPAATQEINDVGSVVGARPKTEEEVGHEVGVAQERGVDNPVGAVVKAEVQSAQNVAKVGRMRRVARSDTEKLTAFNEMWNGGDFTQEMQDLYVKYQKKVGGNVATAICVTFEKYGKLLKADPTIKSDPQKYQQFLMELEGKLRAGNRKIELNRGSKFVQYKEEGVVVKFKDEASAKARALELNAEAKKLDPKTTKQWEAFDNTKAYPGRARKGEKVYVIREAQYPVKTSIEGAEAKAARQEETFEVSEPEPVREPVVELVQESTKSGDVEAESCAKKALREVEAAMDHVGDDELRHIARDGIEDGDLGEYEAPNLLRVRAKAVLRSVESGKDMYSVEEVNGVVDAVAKEMGIDGEAMRFVDEEGLAEFVEGRLPLLRKVVGEMQRALDTGSDLAQNVGLRRDAEGTLVVNQNETVIRKRIVDEFGVLPRSEEDIMEYFGDVMTENTRRLDEAVKKGDKATIKMLQEELAYAQKRMIEYGGVELNIGGTHTRASAGELAMYKDLQARLNNGQWAAVGEWIRQNGQPEQVALFDMLQKHVHSASEMQRMRIKFYLTQNDFAKAAGVTHGKAAGLYFQGRNEIFISMHHYGQKHIIRNVLHEMIHGLTLKHAELYYDSMMGGDVPAEFKPAVEAMGDLDAMYSNLRLMFSAPNGSAPHQTLQKALEESFNAFMQEPGFGYFKQAAKPQIENVIQRRYAFLDYLKVMEDGITFDYSYGRTNFAEFLAESMTNPIFQDMLARLPDPTVMTPSPVPRTLWNRFIDALKKIFGFDPSNSMLEGVMNGVLKVALNEHPILTFENPYAYFRNVPPNLKLDRSNPLRLQLSRSPFITAMALDVVKPTTKGVIDVFGDEGYWSGLVHTNSPYAYGPNRFEILRCMRDKSVGESYVALRDATVDDYAKAFSMAKSTLANCKTAADVENIYNQAKGKTDLFSHAINVMTHVAREQGEINFKRFFDVVQSDTIVSTLTEVISSLKGSTFSEMGPFETINHIIKNANPNRGLSGHTYLFEPPEIKGVPPVSDKKLFGVMQQLRSFGAEVFYFDKYTPAREQSLKDGMFNVGRIKTTDGEYVIGTTGRVFSDQSSLYFSTESRQEEALDMIEEKVEAQRRDQEQFYMQGKLVKIVPPGQKPLPKVKPLITGLNHGTGHDWAPEFLYELPNGKREWYVAGDNIPVDAVLVSEAPLGRMREKIGSGEGGAAYGWGIYIAEHPDVAKTYRKYGLESKPDWKVSIEPPQTTTYEGLVELEQIQRELGRGTRSYDELITNVARKLTKFKDQKSFLSNKNALQTDLEVKQLTWLDQAIPEFESILAWIKQKPVYEPISAAAFNSIEGIYRPHIQGDVTKHPFIDVIKSYLDDLYDNTRHGLLRRESTPSLLRKAIEYHHSEAKTRKRMPSDITQENLQQVMRDGLASDLATLETMLKDPEVKVYQPKLEVQGNTYHLEYLVEPEQLLIWDRPFSQQSEFVKQVLRELLDLKPTDQNETFLQTLRAVRNTLSNYPEELVREITSARLDNELDTYYSLINEGLSETYQVGDTYRLGKTLYTVGLNPDTNRLFLHQKGDYIERTFTIHQPSEIASILLGHTISELDKVISRTSTRVAELRSGRDLYHEIGNTIKEVRDSGFYENIELAEHASKTLLAKGIRGIKFDDQGTRYGYAADNKPTYNYVVFDSKDIRVTGLNGEFLPLDTIVKNRGVKYQRENVGVNYSHELGDVTGIADVTGGSRENLQEFRGIQQQFEPRWSVETAVANGLSGLGLGKSELQGAVRLAVRMVESLGRMGEVDIRTLKSPDRRIRGLYFDEKSPGLNRVVALADFSDLPKKDAVYLQRLTLAHELVHDVVAQGGESVQRLRVVLEKEGEVFRAQALKDLMKEIVPKRFRESKELEAMLGNSAKSGEETLTMLASLVAMGHTEVVAGFGKRIALLPMEIGDFVVESVKHLRNVVGGLKMATMWGEKGVSPVLGNEVKATVESVKELMGKLLKTKEEIDRAETEVLRLYNLSPESLVDLMEGFVEGRVLETDITSANVPAWAHPLVGRAQSRMGLRGDVAEIYFGTRGNSWKRFLDFMKWQFMPSAQFAELEPAARGMIHHVFEHGPTVDRGMLMVLAPFGAQVINGQVHFASGALQPLKRVAKSPMLKKRLSNIRRWQNANKHQVMNPHSAEGRMMDHFGGLAPADFDALQTVSVAMDASTKAAQELYIRGEKEFLKTVCGIDVARHIRGPVAQSRKQGMAFVEACVKLNDVNPVVQLQGRNELVAASAGLDPVRVTEMEQWYTSMLKQVDSLDQWYQTRPGFTSERRFGKFAIKYLDRTSGKTGMRDFNDRGTFEKVLKQMQGDATKDITWIKDPKPGHSEVETFIDDEVVDIVGQYNLKLKQAVAQRLGPALYGRVEQLLDFEDNLHRAQAAQNVTAKGTKQYLKPGREYLDMLENHFKYLSALVGQVSKKTMKSNVTLESMDPHLDSRPDLINYARQLADNTLTPDSQLGRMLSQAAFIKFMGFHISSHILELGQSIFALAPQMVADGMSTPAAYARIAKASSIINQGLATNKWSADHKWLLQAAANEGQIGLGSMQETLGKEGYTAMQLAMLRDGKPLKSMGEAMAAPIGAMSSAMGSVYSIFTKYNARLALFTAFDYYKSKGFTNQEAYAQAKRSNWVSNMAGGRAARPVGLFDTKNIPRSASQAIYALNSYTAGMVGMAYRFLEHGWGNRTDLTPEQRKSARRAARTFLLTQVVAAGALGLPGVGAALALIEMMSPTAQVNKDVREALEKLGGEDEETGRIISNVILSGIPSTFTPVDVSTRYALGNILGTSSFNGFSVDNILGAVGSMIKDMAIGTEQIVAGNETAGAIRFLPVQFQKLADAIRNKGDIVDKQGQLLLKPRMAEQAAYFAGFTPKRIAEVRTKSRLMERARKVQAFTEKRLATDVAGRYLQGDTQGAQQVFNMFVNQNPEYSPSTGLDQVAQQVERRTFPYDPRREGGKHTISQEGDVLKLFQSQEPSELPRLMQRLTTKSQIAPQYMGMPTTSDFTNAGMLDALMQADPNLTKAGAQLQQRRMTNPTFADLPRFSE